MTEFRGRLIATEHLTLDGMYEDAAQTTAEVDGTAQHSGWAVTDDDPEVQQAVGRYMQGGWSLLVGRTTYEELYESWAVRQPSHPMTQALTGVQKFVATHDPQYHPRWENTTRLAGEATEAVARLKAEQDTPLLIFGSGILAQSLMARSLIDEFLLMIHPLVRGQGRRFFGDGVDTRLRLSDQCATNTGVLIATYQLNPA